MTDHTPNRITVNFVCQRCLQPIKLDSSFSSIDDYTIAELSVPIIEKLESDINEPAARLNVDHHVSDFHFCDSSSGLNGFTIVGGYGDTHTPLGNRIKLAADLFDILSSNTEIDHPLCEECTDTLMDLMDQQLKLTEDDYVEYTKFLKKLEEEDTGKDLLQFSTELNDLVLEESKLRQEVEELLKEEKTVEEELAEQEKLREQLSGEEQECWREYSKHRIEYIYLEDEIRSLDFQQNYVNNQLKRLKGTNVFNATFHIWRSHGGHFGTINNFRLGRLPSAPVEWCEINAAWGQTALLLTSIARKMNFTFQKYKIVPYGNHSYIQVLDDQKQVKTFPLYGAGGIKYVWDTKFDSGMVAFLDCLRQFKEEVEKGGKKTGFCLPYKIIKDKLDDSKAAYSVKSQFNTEEEWTKALKFLLTNLKWGLAWVSLQYYKED